MTGADTYARGVVITKSDTVNYDNTTVSGPTKPIPSQGIYVGGAGIVAAVFEDGSVVNFTAVSGQILPLKTIRVNNTNTTATLMVALYV